MRTSLSFFLSFSLCWIVFGPHTALASSADDTPDLSSYYKSEPSGEISDAGDSATAKDYYTDSAKNGWWWGHYKAPEKKKVDKDTEKKSQEQKVTADKRPTIDELRKMDAKDLRAYFDEVQDQAVSTPTEKNVLWYFTVQDVIRRRSTAFMNTSQYVMQKYPELNTETDYPINAPGRNAMTKQTIDDVESVVRHSKDDFALLYFYASGCQYCQAQDNILQGFVSLYEWQIQPEEFSSHQQLASSLGVYMTPSLALIKKGNNKNFIPISAGVITVPELVDKIYRGIRLLSGNITPEEYSIYNFQKGSSFDVTAPYKNEQIGR